jgi:hypothetical protein
MKAIILITTAFILVGCASAPVVVRDTKKSEINISQTLLDCPDKKVKVPNPKGLTDQQVAQYILKLNSLLNECKSDVRTIEKLLKEYNQKVKEFNK